METSPQTDKHLSEAAHYFSAHHRQPLELILQFVETDL